MTAAVTAYTVVKFLHVLLAIVWVGGAILLQMLARSAMASRLSGRAAEFAGEVENIGKRVFTPISILMLLLGLYLVQEGDWGFGSFWVSAAILGLLVSIAVGAGYLGPQFGKLGKLIQGEGSDSPAVREKIATILRVARMDIALLVLIVFLMVTKLGD